MLHKSQGIFEEECKNQFIHYGKTEAFRWKPKKMRKMGGYLVKTLLPNLDFNLSYFSGFILFLVTVTLVTALFRNLVFKTPIASNITYIDFVNFKTVEVTYWVLYFKKILKFVPIVATSFISAALLNIQTHFTYLISLWKGLSSHFCLIWYLWNI